MNRVYTNPLSTAVGRLLERFRVTVWKFEADSNARTNYKFPAIWKIKTHL